MKGIGRVGYNLEWVKYDLIMVQFLVLNGYKGSRVQKQEFNIIMVIIIKER
jgi:hypothetical protein